MHKLVNGVRVEMTEDEVSSFNVSRTPMVKRPARMPKYAVLLEALKEKGVLTDAELDTANAALLSKVPSR